MMQLDLNPLGQFNAAVIVATVVTFLLVFAIVRKVLVVPVATVLLERDAKLAEAARLESEATALVAQARAAADGLLAVARTEADDTRHRAQSEAAELRRRIVGEADRMYAEEVARGRRAIDAANLAAREALLDRALAAAQSACAAFPEAPTPDEVEDAVRHAVARLPESGETR